MTPQELKNSILQLAIQGRLVEQRPEEGTAKELLREILAAKNAKNAKGGARSRATALMTGGTSGTGVTGARPSRRSARPASPAGPASPTPVPPEDQPFEIPESWEWVRLGEVAEIVRGSGIKRSETSSSGFPCVRYGEIYTTYGYSFTSTKSFVTESAASSCHKANHGDVLCTLTGEWKEEIAKATAYLGDVPIAIGGDLAKISSRAFDPLLLVYFFFAPFMLNQKASEANGNIIVHIGKDAISSLLIPLPPLAEQKRIVAKIEELLPLIDRYERAWSKLEDFNRRFPVDMQKSVLQMAIQGKLVEQRPEEGTGEELLREILAAKNAKENLTRRRGGAENLSGGSRSRATVVGEGKADLKHLPKAALSLHGTLSAPSASPREKIPPEDQPFEIPESWVWVRLETVLSVQPSNGFSPKAVNYQTPYKSLTLTATTSGYFKSGAFKYVDITADTAEKYYLEDDDILVQRSNSRELVGTSCIYRHGNKKFIYPDLMMRFHLMDGINVDYIDFVLKSPVCRSYYQRTASGTSESMPKINQAIVRNTLIPLPPLAEQKRIVAKLEEILPLCERLKGAVPL